MSDADVKALRDDLMCQCAASPWGEAPASPGTPRRARFVVRLAYAQPWLSASPSEPGTVHARRAHTEKTSPTPRTRPARHDLTAGRPERGAAAGKQP